MYRTTSLSIFALMAALALPAVAQEATAPAEGEAAQATEAAMADSQEEGLLTSAELEQLLAPVALYPDTLLVQVLSMVGFSIADLVFAIYGSQVGLCPLAISALLLKRRQLNRMSDWAASAVSAGFVIGWGSAAFGVLTKQASLVFLAPAFSLVVSGILLAAGFLVSGAWKAPENDLDPA